MLNLDAAVDPSLDALVHGRRVLTEEAEALHSLAARLDDRFARATRMIGDCAGRVVVTGMGKSGAVGRKIAGTLASTGTPALSLHPGEAMHGDLGMLTAQDIVLALSYSGETDELLNVLPALKRRGAGLIAITGGLSSSLAEAADITLDVSVPREACPLDLAPTTSTTAMMAMGDALAIAVMEMRGFSREDYALLHPAGSLGRRLLVHVSDIMRKGDELAIVAAGTTVHAALFAITHAGAGAACIVDAGGVMIGIITDGDVRRFLLSDASGLERPVEDAMTRCPRHIVGDPLAYEAVQQFERSGARIGDLPVVDEEGMPVGMLMLKDLLRAGIV